MRIPACTILLAAALASLPSCYLSGGRGHLGGDASTEPDSTSDSAGTDAMDTQEAEEAPDPACLYEQAGTRQVTSGYHTADAPHIYWNGSEVGVVMFEGGGSMIEHSHVSLVNVAADLSAQGAITTIGEESHGWGEPAWTGSRLGLCWHLDPAYVSRTAFRLHDASGAAVSERVDLDFDGEACLGLEHGGDRFLAAWRHITLDAATGESVVDTRIQVLDASGRPAADPLDVVVGASYPGVTPSIEFGDGEFVVAVARGDSVEIMRIATTGGPAGTISIPADGAEYATLAVRGEDAALAWLTGERGERGLRLAALGPDLSPPSSVTIVEEDGAGASSASIEAAPDGWVLSWSVGSGEEAYAMVLHVDAAGIPREPRILLALGQNSGYGGPSLAAVEDDLYVGYSRYPEDEWLEQIHIARLACVPGSMDICAPQDAAVDSLDICEDPILFGYAWDGESCVEILGCSCLGEDCGSLSRNRWECLSDRQHCL